MAGVQPQDRISLLGLVFFGYHGAYPPERELGQRFEVDVEMSCDCRQAAATDDLLTALDYSRVYARVKQAVEGPPVNLLETLAERVAQEVMAFPGVEQVLVRVRKPQAPLPGVFGTMQVELVRRAREQSGGPRVAYLGLGSNLGDREGFLRQALTRLEQAGRVKRLSPVYETAPWGYTEQGPFLNLVAEIEAELAPEELLGTMQRIERELGRERSIRWGPRTIDLDILLYGDLVMDRPELTLPHPCLMERAFVLVPLADLAPDLVIPGAGRTVSEALRTLPGDQGIRPWGVLRQ